MEKSGYGVRETGSLKSDLQLSYMCHIVSGILGYLAYPFMLFDDTATGVDFFMLFDDTFHELTIERS